MSGYTMVLRRGEYFAGLFFASFASGLTERIIHSVREVGWAEAAARTFDISVIVIAACAAGIFLLLCDRTKGIRPFEIAIGAVVLLTAIQPVGRLSLIAATALSLYIITTTDVPTTKRGAIILLASTVPLLWSRALFYFFSDQILAADAFMVSLLLNTHRVGNIVDFADQSGQLAIFAPCSSLANVSLAFLCWIGLTQFLAPKKSIVNGLWLIACIVAVIAANVVRITVLGISRWSYDTFHNPLGDTVTNAVVLLLIIGICAFGVRHEIAKQLQPG